MEEPFQTTDDCQNDNVILPDGWTAILVENNRWLYLHETKKNCCWLPPAKSWISRRSLPYGWESARSNDGRRYYINHLTKETVRRLPSSNSSTASVTPRTREVVISRHLEIGFGFVAGSEKPVLIRSVAEDGPSAGKLHANDQILKINDEDVRDLPQADVILRIKNYNEELRLEVIANDDVQDVKNQGQRKSSIMSRTTREKRRSNPVSVRFAETPVLIQYVGSPPSYPLKRSSLPLLPNVLKIFLENGQTRSFLYNSSTTIKDLSMSLGEKIGLKRLDRFSLILQSSQNDSYIQQNERASEIYLRRHCSSSTWLCKFHLVLAPRDIHFLLKEDPMAFDYFYKQVCSQVVEGRFGWELKYDTAIKLAALHLQQYALEDKVGKSSKISVKAIEKEVGSLDPFVPKALINTMQKKDLQRVLTQQMKQTRNLCPPGQKHISPLQAKLQYLKIVSEMKTYGGKQFNAIILDSTEDPVIFQDEKLTSLIFVGPNVGLAHVTNPRSFSMNQLAAFNQINGLVVTPHTEGKQNVKLFLTNGKAVTLILGPIYETQDLIYLISGYCKYFVENAKYLSIIDMTATESVDTSDENDTVPPYAKRHRVLPDKWNYKENPEQNNDEDLKEINFVQKPKFDGSEHYSVIASGNEDDESPSRHHVCNGDVKTNLKIQQNNENIVEKDLRRIAEESSPQKKDVEALKDFGKVFENVDGKHRQDESIESNDKKAPVHLSDDEEEKISKTKAVKTNINDNNNVAPVQYELVNSLKDDIPVVIDDGLPYSLLHDKTNRDAEPLQADDPVTNPMSPLLQDDDPVKNPTSPPLQDDNAVKNPTSPPLQDDNTVKNPKSPPLQDDNAVKNPTSPPLQDDNAVKNPTSPPLQDDNAVKNPKSPPLQDDNAVKNPTSPPLQDDNAVKNPTLPPLQDDNAVKNPTSPPLQDDNAVKNPTSPPLQDDDAVKNPISVESAEVGIRNSSDSIPSHQASGNILRTRSSVSSPAASKDSVTSISLSSNDVTTPLSDLRLNHEQDGSNLQDNRISKGTTTNLNTGDQSQKNDKVGVNKEDNTTDKVPAIGIYGNISSENTLRNINCDKKENDNIIDDLNVKRNGYDVKAERLKRRRLSSGYIPTQTVNGDIHRNIFTPECIILDDIIPKPQGFRKSNEAEITSRSKACDHALKMLYSLKTKLSTLLHSKRSVRTSNEILGAKKQLMVDKIAVLEECIKLIQKLASTDEKEVVKTVLRSSRAFDLLTESCSLLYNAQYSMRHFTTELDNAIDKYIDVLITTDAWNSINISDMTMELHKDNCDLVHQVLSSLRKIINTL